VVLKSLCSAMALLPFTATWAWPLHRLLEAKEPSRQARSSVSLAELESRLTVRGFMASKVVNETLATQIEHVRLGLRLAGLRDHVHEAENFGIVPDSRLRTDLVGKTPLTVPGATTIRTPELAALLRDGKPIVIDACPGNRTSPVRSVCTRL
jgi:hypothetical protein